MSDLFLIERGGDQRLIALHHIGQGDIARGPQNPRQLAGANRVMPGVHHKDFKEIFGQVAPFAQIIDQPAHGHMFGHRHEVAAHQSAGGFFREGKRGFDRDAIFRLQRGQNRLLVILVQIFDQLNRVIGFQLFGNLRHAGRGQRFHHVLADIIVEFSDHLAAHQIGDGGGQITPFVPVEQFEKVSDIGGVKRFDQIVNPLSLAVFQRIANGADEFGLERVVLVHPLVVDAVVGACPFVRRTLGVQRGQHHIIIGRALILGHACALGRWVSKASQMPNGVTHSPQSLYRPARL